MLPIMLCLGRIQFPQLHRDHWAHKESRHGSTDHSRGGKTNLHTRMEHLLLRGSHFLGLASQSASPRDSPAIVVMTICALLMIPLLKRTTCSTWMIIVLTYVGLVSVVVLGGTYVHFHMVHGCFGLVMSFSSRVTERRRSDSRTADRDVHRNAGLVGDRRFFTL